MCLLDQPNCQEAVNTVFTLKNGLRTAARGRKDIMIARQLELEHAEPVATLEFKLKALALRKMTGSPG